MPRMVVGPAGSPRIAMAMMVVATGSSMVRVTVLARVRRARAAGQKGAGAGGGDHTEVEQRCARGATVSCSAHSGTGGGAQIDGGDEADQVAVFVGDGAAV